MGGRAEGLRREAATLRLEADRVRAMALRVGVLGGLRWRSPAADLFRARVAARAHALERAAEEVRALAVRFESLAAAVDHAAVVDDLRGLLPGRSAGDHRGGSGGA